MVYNLKNENIELEVELPGTGYRAPRFDQSGKIARCTYRGVTITNSELPFENNPELNGQGFYNEFDIDSPPGFVETRIGEWFHKIGVGLLKKESEVYNFTHPYQVRPARFEVDSKPEHLVITCIGPSSNGYSYQLLKAISLGDNGFRIDYHLKNTGEKPLETSEYVHNFIGFSRSAIGEDYLLMFPAGIAENLLFEAVNPDEKVLIDGNQVNFSGTHDVPFFFSHLFGQQEVRATWKLINRKYNLVITETGDFKTSKVNLWGWRHVVCPELFINLKLEPGQLASWSRNFLIEEINSPLQDRS